MLGAVWRLWSGDDTLAIFCGKALIQLMEFDDRCWESWCSCEKIEFRQERCDAVQLG